MTSAKRSKLTLNLGFWTSNQSTRKGKLANMSDSYSRETDDHKSKAREAEREGSSSHDVATMAMPGNLAVYSSTLLASNRMGGRGECVGT